MLSANRVVRDQHGHPPMLIFLTSRHDGDDYANHLVARSLFSEAPRTFIPRSDVLRETPRTQIRAATRPSSTKLDVTLLVGHRSFLASCYNPRFSHLATPCLIHYHVGRQDAVRTSGLTCLKL